MNGKLTLLMLKNIGKLSRRKSLIINNSGKMFLPKRLFWEQKIDLRYEIGACCDLRKLRINDKVKCKFNVFAFYFLSIFVYKNFPFSLSKYFSPIFFSRPNASRLLAISVFNWHVFCINIQSIPVYSRCVASFVSVERNFVLPFDHKWKWSAKYFHENFPSRRKTHQSMQIELIEQFVC